MLLTIQLNISECSVVEAVQLTLSLAFTLNRSYSGIVVFLCGANSAGTYVYAHLQHDDHYTVPTCATGAQNNSYRQQSNGLVRFSIQSANGLCHNSTTSSNSCFILKYIHIDGRCSLHAPLVHSVDQYGKVCQSRLFTCRTEACAHTCST
jgi:hypothetical protein